MLKIHEFAQQAGVTTRLLRYYDSLGLFKPAAVDRDSSYRYYTLEQLEMLHRIMALRGLGLPLQQIADIITLALPTADLASILHAQQIHLENSIARDLSRLKEAQARLEALTTPIPYQDVVIKLLPLGKGLRVCAELGAEENIPDLFAQISHALYTHHLYKRVESIIGIYPRHAMLVQPVTFPFPFEAVYIMPIARLKSISLSGGRQLEPFESTAVIQAACVLHIGSYQTLFDSYRGVFNYLKTYGHRITGAPREVYLRGQTASGQPMTEIQIPIASQGSLPENVPT